MKKYRHRFNSADEDQYKSINFRLMFYDIYIADLERNISRILEEVRSVEEDDIVKYYTKLKHEEYNVIYFDSSLLAIYSFIEKQLYRLCLDLEKHSEIKLEDISGKGVRKYKTFLDKVARIWKTSYNSDYDHLLKYGKLRNYLVHSPDSRIVDNSLKKTLQGINGIIIVEKQEKYLLEFTDKTVLTDLLLIGKRLLADLALEEI